MICKNCQHTLLDKDKFCNNCGAKVVDDRITFKKLFSDFFINVFGFDSAFFITLKKLILRPDAVINDYLGGVRKRYMNPFAFLAIGAALSLLTFNYYADDFIAINSAINSEQILETKQKATMEISKDLPKEEIKKLEFEKKSAQFQMKYNDGVMQFMLRYYNLLTFVFLFLYAILSKWTFWKPHNFGEHIIINAYIYGLTTYISVILFLVSIVVHPAIYFFSIIIYILFYMYSFGRFYNLTIGKNILKLLRFLVGLFIFSLFTMIIFGLIAVAIGYFGLIKL